MDNTTIGQILAALAEAQAALGGRFSMGVEPNRHDGRDPIFVTHWTSPKPDGFADCKTVGLYATGADAIAGLRDYVRTERLLAEAA